MAGILRSLVQIRLGGLIFIFMTQYMPTDLVEVVAVGT